MVVQPGPPGGAEQVRGEQGGVQGRNSARILGIRASSAGVARASIPAEILAYARAAYPQRRSWNENNLCGRNSARSAEICAIFQRDILPRHF